MLFSPLDALLTLPKTTSPPKMFPTDHCKENTAVNWTTRKETIILFMSFSFMKFYEYPFMFTIETSEVFEKITAKLIFFMKIK